LEDYEILSTALSALEWRKNNGAIFMITDKCGADYYRALGIESFWDGGINDALEGAVDGDIDPSPFWAAGKLYALRSMSAPCVMIDTDFIVWQPIAALLDGTALAVVHREELNDEIYPPKPRFDMEPGYDFPASWDWSVDPCNTALLYISDNLFKDYYTSQSINFMRNVRKNMNLVVEMVFAEQRLLAMCANEKDVPVKSLLDIFSLDDQTLFTHLWGYKSFIKEIERERFFLCKACAGRLVEDFPVESAILANIDTLKLYFSSVD
jgi:hypothetical protein